MNIGSASIKKFTNTGNYLICCESRIKMGASIVTEPIIRLEASTPIDEVMNQILYALSCSKSALPNPMDWQTHNKEYFKLVGIKRNSDLYKNVIEVGVFIKDDIITFTPMINNGAKGFVNVPNAQIENSAQSNIKELSTSLQAALGKCE
jgi:hypothetical protein